MTTMPTAPARRTISFMLCTGICGAAGLLAGMLLLALATVPALRVGISTKTGLQWHEPREVAVLGIGLLAVASVFVLASVLEKLVRGVGAVFVLAPAIPISMYAAGCIRALYSMSEPLDIRLSANGYGEIVTVAVVATSLVLTLACIVRAFLPKADASVA